VVALVAACSSTAILRKLRPPQNDVERRDEMTYDTIRRFQKVAHDGNFHNALPLEVVVALERAACAHQSAVARIVTEDPSGIITRTKALDDCLHACLMAAEPVLRNDKHSRKEWTALGENKAFIGSIVDSIEVAVRRMDGEAGADWERLAAIRELESDLPEVHALAD